MLIRLSKRAVASRERASRPDPWRSGALPACKSVRDCSSWLHKSVHTWSRGDDGIYMLNHVSVIRTANVNVKILHELDVSAFPP